MQTTNWIKPPVNLKLDPYQVDIWRVSLDSGKWTESSLSADEVQRAACFRFDEDRNRFIASHTSLRDVLSRYLHCNPTQITFTTSAYGKPAIPSDIDLEFNLSHSGDFALFVVARGHKVGIDIERFHANRDLEKIAHRFFSEIEFSEFTKLPPAQKTHGFYNCWTRKEAYIKAHGLGLSLPLNSFDVSLTPNEPAILLGTRPNTQEASRWTLLSLIVHPDYAGAVVVEGQGQEFRFWDWEFKA